MLTYTYVARNTTTGSKVTADVEADSEQAAARVLLERGLSPLEIKLKTERKGPQAFFNRISTKEKVIFSRQLSTLINAGLPLVQSLNTVRGQTSDKNLKTIIGKVITDVEAGSSLSQALGRYPKVFSQVFIFLVAAGETSGTLDKALERLANQQEKDAEIVSKIRGALIYPLLVILVLVAITIFMLTTVIPQVRNLYESLPGVKLPILTRILLSISHFLVSFWWIMLLVFIVGAVVLFQWSRTRSGRLWFDNLKLKTPLIGPLFMKVYMARFANTSSTLVASGVPILQMLMTAAAAVDNRHIAAAVLSASEKVKGGKALSDAMAEDHHFPELVPNMIHIGEQSGNLDTMLAKVADYYEKEVDNQVKNISTTIEPVLMILVGIIAMIVVAAVLLPIYNLAGKNLLRPY